MPIPTYVPGYPPDGSSLGETKSTVRNNLDGTFQTLAVDHINNNGQPGSQPAGYHTVIHEVSQTTVNTVADYNQVFSGVPGSLTVNATVTPTIPPGGDTQLYSLSGAGVLSQLTGGVGNLDGYAWVGGILLQWGFEGTSASTAVLFPKTFRNVWNVQLTPIRLSAGAPPNTGMLTVLGALSTSGFTASYGGPGSITTFYWLAIGN